MGCHTYVIGGSTIHFNESNDNISCLCTFPHNDQETLSPGRAEALALFGVAVKLIYAGELKGEITIPDDLPEWIVKGIRSSIKEPIHQLDEPLQDTEFASWDDEPGYYG